MDFLAHIFVCGCLFIGIDALWLGTIANDYYKDQLHGLLARQPNFAAGFVFYVIYLWALLYFALEPGLYNNDMTYLLKHAALFGFAAYATYDLTNMATLKHWPLKIAVIDIVWGTLLTTGVAAAGYVIFP